MAKNSKKILLVEDEELLRGVYYDILTDEGFQVDTAEEGISALEKITTGTYDLILLDIILPNKDGLQVLRQLKIHPPKNSNLNIVLMTNLAEESLVTDTRQYNIRDIINKSQLTPDTYLAKVKTYLTS